jgi:ABC-2 type transport system ATP-binding protein
VLLSSHLLAEVQATADHLVIISAGRIVAAGALADLLADHASLEDLFLTLTSPAADISARAHAPKVTP